MDAQEIAERADVLDGIDTPACHRCGAPAPDGAASDPRWFIDTEQVARPLDERAPSHLTVFDTHAIIYCPTCR